MIAWLLLIITLVIIIYKYADRKFKYWENRGIPSEITSLPTALKEMNENMKLPQHEIQRNYYRKHGRIFGIFLGSEPQLIVAEPDLIKKILIKDFHMFHNRIKMRIGEPSFDKNLSVLEGEDWKRVRIIMSPTFTSGRMRQISFLVKECSARFAECCEKLAEVDQPIDIKKYFCYFVLDAVSCTAFGTKTNFLEDQSNKFVITFRKLFDVDMPFIQIMMSLFRCIRLLLGYFAGHLFQYFAKFTLHVIKEREKNKLQANDFLQLMMDAQKGVLEKLSENSTEEKEHEIYIQEIRKNKSMSRDELLAQCNLFIIAGSETNINALGFIAYHLVLNPDCQKKLIQEIDEMWEKHDEINFDDVNQLQYLDAVLKESLRLTPIAYQLVRECTEDYELGDTGIHIPKGMNVMIPIYSMQHDPEFFPDPENFFPERFLPENYSSIPHNVYMPFGDGPRNCIGMRFAIMMMKIGIVYLFRNLQIYATEETKKPLEFYRGQGQLQPKKIIVKLQKRK